MAALYISTKESNALFPIISYVKESEKEILNPSLYGVPH